VLGLVKKAPVAHTLFCCRDLQLFADTEALGIGELSELEFEIQRVLLPSDALPGLLCFQPGRISALRISSCILVSLIPISAVLIVLANILWVNPLPIVDPGSGAGELEGGQP
jgi:hypothetical protein